MGAKPHLGTLPSLKQIRPQRLIKTLHVQSFMDEGAPKRGATARPPSAPPTMNSHSAGRRFFGRGRKSVSLCAVFFSWLLNGATKGKEKKTKTQNNDAELVLRTAARESKLFNLWTNRSHGHTWRRRSTLHPSERRGSTCLKADRGVVGLVAQAGCVHCTRAGIYIFKKKQQEKGICVSHAFQRSGRNHAGNAQQHGAVQSPQQLTCSR